MCIRDRVDMDRLVHHRIELVVARDHAVLLAVEIDGDDVAQEAAGIDREVRIVVADRDRQGVLLVAVNDSGDEAFTTNSTSGPLAYPAARLGLQFGSRHGTCPWVGAMRWISAQSIARPSSRGDRRFMARAYRGKARAGQGVRAGSPLGPPSSGRRGDHRDPSG